MKVVRGPRPLAIRAFAACLFLFALINLVAGLADLGTSQAILARYVPSLAWDRDRTIIALFTQFTIALIPLVWIYVFAAGFARWLVFTFGLAKLAWVLFSLFAALWFGEGELLRLTLALLLGSALVLLLFPNSRAWLSPKNEGSLASDR